VTTAATIADVVAAMEDLFPARWADDGDPVGLVIGDPAGEVRRILLAIDPVQAVADEAFTSDSDLLVTHHPLLFRAVHSIAASTPKGRVVHDLIRHGIGLFVAHTNADSPPGGVSESLALALGLEDLRPLETDPRDPLDKIITFVPTEQADAVVDALAAAGAGSIGTYDRCAFVSDGVGTFRPGQGSRPAIGAVGTVEVVEERRVEMVLPRRRREAVVAALRTAHPYEEPAFDVFEEAPWAGERGTGRVGRLKDPLTLHAFTDQVVAALPSTPVGARVSGDLEALVSRVAVVGGAGDFMLGHAREAGVDVFVTSDLRHHPASELREHVGAPALVDVPHWAAEWTWLPRAAQALTHRLAQHDLAVTCEVSRLCTDPWNYQRSTN
jgi:dinuclear metal center YbgI/SA1388 family protein